MERISEVFNIDCMVGMAQYPDKYFDLAVVDPPYGIGEDGVGKSRHKGGNVFTEFKKKNWDNVRPTAQYFKELKRVSKHQIIWGANYYPEHLSPSMGWIFWDKNIGGDFSDGELAYTSFQRALRMVSITVERNCATNAVSAMKYKRIHPCQKPIKLYSWIYKNYLPEGGKVIDTHLGSGSNRIAATKAGNIDFTGYELDNDYFDAMEKRYKDFKSQTVMEFV